MRHSSLAPLLPDALLWCGHPPSRADANKPHPCYPLLETSPAAPPPAPMELHKALFTSLIISSSAEVSSSGVFKHGLPRLSNGKVGGGSVRGGESPTCIK